MTVKDPVSVVPGATKAGWVRKGLASAAVVCAAAVLAVAPIQQASATGWNCNSGYSTVGAWGTCANTDGGGYAVKVLCQYYWWVPGLGYAAYVKTGNRVYVSGQLSSVQGCSWNSHYLGSPWV